MDGSAPNAGSRTAVALICLVLAAVACADGSGSSAPTATSGVPSSAPAPTSPSVTNSNDPTSSPNEPGEPTEPTTESTPSDTGSVIGANADPTQFDPSTFSWPWPEPNQWLPLVPGYQSVRDGTVTRGGREIHHQRVYTVTAATKDIAGVTTILVLDQDFDGGEVAEQAIDYLAQDTEGNVWYLGSYTEGYQAGQFVAAHDAWLAGTDGAEAGVMMMSDPTEGMPAYMQASVPGEGVARAEIAAVGISKCVPYTCFDDVLATLEDGSEFKYFARGVGAILTEPNYSGGEQEIEELVNITELSADGLNELTDEALRLDEHAATTAPRVFGESEPAQRIS